MRSLIHYFSSFMLDHFNQLTFWTFQHLTAVLFFGYCLFVGFITSLKLDLWQSSFDLQQQYKKFDLYGFRGSVNNIYSMLFFSLCIGLGIIISSLLVLGLIDGFQKNTVLAMMLFWLLFCAAIIVFDSKIQLRFKQIKQEWKFSSSSFFEITAVLLILLAVMFSYIKTLGKWDDTSFHLPLAAGYVKNGGLFLNEYLRFPLIAQNINLLFVWALMFSDHVLAQAMATLPLFVTCLGLLAISVWLTKSTWVGFIAILIFLTSGSVLDSLGYAYIDNGFGLLCFAAIFSFLIAVQYQSNVWVLIAGFFAGMALGSKYFAIPLIGLLGLWLLWKKQFRFAFYFSLMVLVFGSAWYIRSFIISGDPIHPMGGKWFGYFLWNEADTKGQFADVSRLAVGSAPWLFLSSLFHIQAPVLILAFTPIFFVLKLNSSVRVLLFVWLGYFFFWFFFAQVQRYLAPVLTVGAFLSAYSIYLCLAKFFWFSYQKLQKNSPLLGMLIAIALSIFSFKTMLIHVSDNQEILKSRKNAGYELYQHANTLKSKFGDRILQLNFEQGIYFFDGTVIGDVFGFGRYTQFQKHQNGRCELIPAEEMKEVMKKLKVRMLLVNDGCGFPEINTYPIYFRLEKKASNGVLLSL